jgi:hypothetical protein
MRSSLTAGLSFMTLGLFFVALPALRGEEKAAIFFLGHWFDIIWELAVPCLAIGVLLCVSASLRFLFLHRRGAEAQSSEGT